MKKFATKKATTEDEVYNPHCKIYSNETIDGNHYDVYLCNEIVTVDAYSDLLNLLFAASSQDIVHLKINSPGGDLDTCLQIQDAIGKTEAKVIGYLSGSADSAASAIFCTCHEHYVGDHAMMLVHTVSHGFFAEAHDMLLRSEIIYDQNINWLRSTYLGFVSEEEIEQIVVNKLQLMLTADEIKERIANMVEARSADQEEETDKVNINLVELLTDMQYIKKWIEKQEASKNESED